MSTSNNDAIVVLGCRVEASGELSATLARRAAWAAVAHEAKLARWVIPSGGRRWGEHVEAEQLAAFLERRGVPSADILPELYSLTTAENAVFSTKILQRAGAKRALVVTCNWHMRRALACFRALGVEALPLPVPTPPSSLAAWTLRRAHELFSGRLDAWMIERLERVRVRGGAHPWSN